MYTFVSEFITWNIIYIHRWIFINENIPFDVSCHIFLSFGDVCVFIYSIFIYDMIWYVCLFVMIWCMFICIFFIVFFFYDKYTCSKVWKIYDERWSNTMEDVVDGHDKHISSSFEFWMITFGHTILDTMLLIICERRRLFLFI